MVLERRRANRSAAYLFVGDVLGCIVVRRGNQLRIVQIITGIKPDLAVTGAQIGQGSGYAITTGLFQNGVRVSTDFALSNFFYFTVNADTATTGNVKGGGYGCSVGPITITP